MGDQRTRETRSPPKDKESSLDHDCRNDFGENDKSSRKAIPLFKAQSNRRGRHAAKVAVNGLIDDDSINEMRQLALADAKSLRPAKSKSPDRPLGDYLERKYIWRE